MDSEECAPDFEIGISDKRIADESWQSESSDSEKHPASLDDHAEQTNPNEQTEEDKPITEQQLEKNTQNKRV